MARKPYKRVGRTSSVVAWGERKPLHLWAKDARAGADVNVIIVRLRRGWDPESAIATPAHLPRQIPHEVREATIMFERGMGFSEVLYLTGIDRRTLKAVFEEVASRLQRSSLASYDTNLMKEKTARCPECGAKVLMPCHGCAVKKLVRNRPADLTVTEGDS